MFESCGGGRYSLPTNGGGQRGLNRADIGSFCAGMEKPFSVRNVAWYVKEERANLFRLKWIN